MALKPLWRSLDYLAAGRLAPQREGAEIDFQQLGGHALVDGACADLERAWQKELLS